MAEAFQNWAHSFHDFCPLGIAIAAVWLCAHVGYRRRKSSSSMNWDVVTRDRREPF